MRYVSHDTHDGNVILVVRVRRWYWPWSWKRLQFVKSCRRHEYEIWLDEEGRRPGFRGSYSYDITEAENQLNGLVRIAQIEQARLDAILADDTDEHVPSPVRLVAWNK